MIGVKNDLCINTDKYSEYTIEANVKVESELNRTQDDWNDAKNAPKIEPVADEKFGKREVVVTKINLFDNDDDDVDDDDVDVDVDVVKTLVEKNRFFFKFGLREMRDPVFV